MEVEAAGAIFSMQYVTMLSEGNSNVFMYVANLGLYDKAILREDCINHMAKRLSSGIEELKVNRGLGGKRKLTNVLIKKLTNYRTTALKDSAPIL